MYILFQKYGKTYPDEVTELHRHATWQANKKYVDEHNSNLTPKIGFTVAYSDLDAAEFAGQLIGYRSPPTADPPRGPLSRLTPRRGGLAYKGFCHGDQEPGPVRLLLGLQCNRLPRGAAL